MRIAWLPHAAKRIAACALFAFGTLILQGCGDDSESAAGAPAAPTKDVAPAPDPYAALDAKFQPMAREIEGKYNPRLVPLGQKRDAALKTIEDLKAKAAASAQ